MPREVAQETVIDDLTTTTQAFVGLLTNPYKDVGVTGYGGLTVHPNSETGVVCRLFRGDDALQMGRPKFLSDQIFNKALFGSIISTLNTNSDTGPIGSHLVHKRMGNNLVLMPVNNQRWGIGARTYDQVPSTNNNPERPPQGAPPTFYGNLTYLQTDNGNLNIAPLGVNAYNKALYLDAVGKL